MSALEQISERYEKAKHKRDELRLSWTADNHTVANAELECRVWAEALEIVRGNQFADC